MGRPADRARQADSFCFDRRGRDGWEAESTFWERLKDSIQFGDFDGRQKVYRAYDQPIIRSRFRSDDVDKLLNVGLSAAKIFEQLAMLWLSRNTAIDWCERMKVPAPERWALPEIRRVGAPNKTSTAMNIFKEREKKGFSLASNEAEAALIVESLPKGKRPAPRTLSRLIGQARKKK